MKFTNGAWLPAKGVSAHAVRRVTEYAIDGAKLTLWCVDRAGSGGADRFHGTVLRIEITSPMSDVVRVRMVHDEPSQRGATRFDLDYSMGAPDVKIVDQKEQVIFTSGRVSVQVRKAPLEMVFLDGRDVITSAGPDTPAAGPARGCQPRTK